MDSTGINKKSNKDLTWNSFSRGERWALAKIYEDNYDDLYLYGIKILGNKDETCDIIQDLFLKLWKNRKNLSKPDNIKAYLLRSLRSLILDYIKVFKKKYQYIELTKLEFQIQAETVKKIDKERDLYQQLLAKMERLTERQKEAVYLHYIKGHNYSNVSSVMHIRVQSARNLVFEAIGKLKQK